MAKKKKEEEKVTGRLPLKEIQKMLNKKAGHEVAVNLKENDITKIKEWITTGSVLLDCTINKGSKGGIPVGRITEIAGLSSTGKSFLACLIAAKAQKQGFDVVYFDTERGIGAKFLKKLGCDLDKMLYVIPETAEMMFELIENTLLSVNSENKLLFVWDSLGMTPIKELMSSEGFEPGRHGQRRALVISNALNKLLLPLYESNSTMVITNHLSVDPNAGSILYPTIEQQFKAPGGSKPVYAYHLRLWLVKPRGKKFFTYDDKGFKIGSTTRVKIIKSRFGTEGRECEFGILWGDMGEAGITESEQILDVAKRNNKLKSGSWYTLKYDETREKKFRATEFGNLLKTDEEFRKEILNILEEELVTKFDKRMSNAEHFYGPKKEEIIKESDLAKLD